MNSNGDGNALNVIINEKGEVEIIGVSFSGCKGLNGGAIYSMISGNGKLIVKQTCSFTSCSSVQSGGAIYSTLNSGATGDINIDSTSFTSCSCKQPGNGGALSIIQLTTGNILLNSISFTNCLT
jgi:predicted outer membrane repeat protein